MTYPTERTLGFLRAQERLAQTRNPNQNLSYYFGKKITHYTDLNGFYGIVESGGFWLSDHRFLNDREEFENGRKLTASLLKSLINKPHYSQFKDVLSDTISKISAYCEDPYYICSFSKKADSLDQWRSYSSDGQGISITFAHSRKKLGHLYAQPIISVKQVVYNDKAKVKLLLRIVRSYRKEFLVDLDTNQPRFFKGFIDAWGDELSRQLTVEFINFKHPEYSSEEEVRIAVQSGHLNHFNGVKHRVGKDWIIPYITSKDIYDKQFEELSGTDKLPIIEVRVGPTSNQAMTTKSIEEYLSYKGYKNIQIIKSNVPYRG